MLALDRETFIIRRESVLADHESVTASGLLEEYTELTKGYVVSIHVSVIHYIRLCQSANNRILKTLLETAILFLST